MLAIARRAAAPFMTAAIVSAELKKLD